MCHRACAQIDLRDRRETVAKVRLISSFNWVVAPVRDRTGYAWWPRAAPAVGSIGEGDEQVSGGRRGGGRRRLDRSQGRRLCRLAVVARPRAGLDRTRAICPAPGTRPPAVAQAMTLHTRAPKRSPWYVGACPLQEREPRKAMLGTRHCKGCPS